MPTLGDRHGIDALAGAAPAAPVDVPPHFVPFGMIEDPYADELAQRSAEFARHAAFDDPTPPQGLPVWNPSPPLVHAPPGHSSGTQQPVEPDMTDAADPPLAAQLSLGQRFEMAFAEQDSELELAAGAHKPADLMPDLEDDPTVTLGSPIDHDAEPGSFGRDSGFGDSGSGDSGFGDRGLESGFSEGGLGKGGLDSGFGDRGLESGLGAIAAGDRAAGQRPRFEPLPPVPLPSLPELPELPEQPPSQFHSQAVADLAAPEDAMDPSVRPVSPAYGPLGRQHLAAVPDPQNRPRFRAGPPTDPQGRPQREPLTSPPDQAPQATGMPHAGPITDPPIPDPPLAEQQSRAHLGPAAEQQSRAHLGPAAEQQSRAPFTPAAEQQSRAHLGPAAEQQSRAHLGPVADPQGGQHVRPMADLQGKPHLGPVADAHGGARLGPVPEPWAPAFPGPADPLGGSRAGQDPDLQARRHLAPVTDPSAEPQEPPEPQGETQSATSREDTGLGSVPGDELPQRVPSHPDVPATVEPADDAQQPASPQLSRIASHLRQYSDDPPTERPVGFDTDAVLQAVRSVAGVRQATIRTTATGGHHLRLELAEGADPSTISRMVARMLQEQMGLDAALTGPPGRPDEPGPTGAGGQGGGGDGPQTPRIPGQHDPSGQAGQPPLTLPGPRVGAGATPPSTFDDVPPREPRRRHPVSVPRRQPGDVRPPAEFRSPTDFRPPTDFKPPGETRSPGDARLPGEFRPTSETRSGAEPRRPGDIRFYGDVRQPERVQPENPAPGLPPAMPTDRDQGPRAVIEHVQTSTYGLDATVEVRLTTNGREARGFASGPAVDAYVLRLCAAATAKAVDELLKNGTTTGEAGRCFVEHAAIVPMGSCDVAVVVVLLVCGGWVEQLAGSALVSGDPRRAVVRATLGAVNRRLAALLP